MSGDSVGPIYINPTPRLVKSHVLITLELAKPNYTKWALFFSAMCGEIGLMSHSNGSVVPHPTDPAWEQADCYVRSWLFGSISDTRNMWIKIEGLFHANKDPHAIFLRHQFHSMTQGDMSINDYC